MGIHTIVSLYKKTDLEEILSQEHMDNSKEVKIGGIAYCYFAYSDHEILYPEMSDEIWRLLRNVPSIELEVTH